MAETVNGGSNKQTPKEMSMEVRLLIAFVLMGAVMFVWQLIYKPKPPPRIPGKGATSADTSAAPSAATSNPAANTSAQPPAPTEQASPEATSAPTASKFTSVATPRLSEPVFIVDKDLYRVTFSNQGATVRSWILKKYHGNDEKPLDLMNPYAGIYPFSLYFAGQKPGADVNWAWYKQTGDADGLGVTYDFSDGHTTVRKVFRFQKNSYLSTVSCEVAVDAKPIPAAIEWRGGFGDLTVPTAPANQRSLYFDLTQNKLVEQVAAKPQRTALLQPAATSPSRAWRIPTLPP